jgi:hypothetical protein
VDFDGTHAFVQMRNYRQYCKLPTQGDLLQELGNEKQRIDDELIGLLLQLLRRKLQRCVKYCDKLSNLKWRKQRD